MISLDGVGEDQLSAFKSTVDIGDHLAVTGEVITSKRGELSVMASSWQIAAKTVRPLPNEHNPLSDEARSRMRYVDLIVRPEARDNVRVKAKVLQSLRATLDAHEFIEVDTPVLQHTNGGAAARPFATHTNAFDEDMNIELTMEAKDLLSKRGFDPVLGARPLRRTVQREIEDVMAFTTPRYSG